MAVQRPIVTCSPCNVARSGLRIPACGSGSFPSRTTRTMSAIESRCAAPGRRSGIDLVPEADGRGEDHLQRKWFAAHDLRLGKGGQGGLQHCQSLHGRALVSQWHQAPRAQRVHTVAWKRAAQVRLPVSAAPAAWAVGGGDAHAPAGLPMPTRESRIRSNYLQGKSPNSRPTPRVRQRCALCWRSRQLQ